MRAFFLSFLIFAAGGIVLGERLYPPFSLESDYINICLIALVALAFLIQLDALFSLKKQSQNIQLFEETKKRFEETIKKLEEAEKNLSKNQEQNEADKRRQLKEFNKLQEQQQEQKLEFDKELSTSKRQNNQLKNDLNKKSQENTAEQQVLNLLGLLQEKGRFLDFVKDDISPYPDEQIGAAARVVHQGCSKVLQEIFEIEPLRTEEEGTNIEITAEENTYQNKLIGKVPNKAPYKGQILHRGWGTKSIKLPQNFNNTEPSKIALQVISPAEIELS